MWPQASQSRLCIENIQLVTNATPTRPGSRSSKHEAERVPPTREMSILSFRYLLAHVSPAEPYGSLGQTPTLVVRGSASTRL